MVHAEMKADPLEAFKPISTEDIEIMVEQAKRLQALSDAEIIEGDYHLLADSGT